MEEDVEGGQVMDEERRKWIGEAKGSKYDDGFEESKAWRRRFVKRDDDRGLGAWGVVVIVELCLLRLPVVLVALGVLIEERWKSSGKTQSTTAFPTATAEILPGLERRHSVIANISARDPPTSSPQTPTLGPCVLRYRLDE